MASGEAGSKPACDTGEIKCSTCKGHQVLAGVAWDLGREPACVCFNKNSGSGKTITRCEGNLI
jgi:hypothetical protein